MIHTIDTMTIRRYGRLDRTDNISLLRRWWNPFPVNWFDTEQFFVDFRQIFGEDIYKTKSNEIYKILAQNKIMILDRMLRTMAILMQNQNERSLFTLIFSTPVKEEKSNLKYYQEQVLKITGIDVQNIDDLVKLQNEVQRLIDKFKERFKKDEPQKEKVDFMDVVLGVFSVMEMAFIPDMKLSEFGRLRSMADSKLKRMENKSKHA